MNMFIVYCDLATCYCSTHCLEKARVLYDRALVIGEEAGDRPLLGRVIRSLGALYEHLGQHNKALGRLEQGSAIANEVGDRAGQGTACDNLGICHGHLGQYAKAIELHEQHRAIAEEVGDRAGQAGENVRQPRELLRSAGPV